jgi:hypothetical protein
MTIPGRRRRRRPKEPSRLTTRPPAALPSSRRSTRRCQILRKPVSVVLRDAVDLHRVRTSNTGDRRSPSYCGSGPRCARPRGLSFVDEGRARVSGMNGLSIVATNFAGSITGAVGAGPRRVQPLPEVARFRTRLQRVLQIARGLLNAGLARRRVGRIVTLPSQAHCRCARPICKSRRRRCGGLARTGLDLASAQVAIQTTTMAPRMEIRRSFGIAVLLRWSGSILQRFRFPRPSPGHQQRCSRTYCSNSCPPRRRSPPDLVAVSSLCRNRRDCRLPPSPGPPCPQSSLSGAIAARNNVRDVPTSRSSG